MGLRGSPTRSSTPATTSSMPACLSRAPRRTLPTVGLYLSTAAAATTLIIGSQAGDHLAAAPATTPISASRGIDHIYGDSRRERQHPHPRADDPDRTTPAPCPNLRPADRRRATDLRRRRAAPPPAAPRLQDDVIFGDHGVITHGRRRPEPASLKLQRTRRPSWINVLASIPRRSRTATTTSSSAASATTSSSAARATTCSTATTRTPRLRRQRHHRTPLTATVPPTSPTCRFQTLAGTLIYSRTDRRARGLRRPRKLTRSGSLLVDGTPRNYREPTRPVPGREP